MKVHAIGIAKNSGVSMKKDPKGKEYEMCALMVLTDIEPGSGESKEGGHWKREGYGLQVTEFQCDPSCLHQFKDVKFPAQIEVITDSAPMFGRMQTIIVGLSTKPVLQAAS